VTIFKAIKLKALDAIPKLQKLPDSSPRQSPTNYRNPIKALPTDRAPRPDGYTGIFYKKCWAVIKTDFMAAIITLQQGNARGLGPLNAAYITLIPKKEDAMLAKDFRPISLVHSFAKLVTKILANRLAPHLSSLVATNQSAFIKGRCIHDKLLLSVCAESF